jgi:hypothetical protein
MWTHCVGHHAWKELQLHLDESLDSLHINEQHQTEQMPMVLLLQ